MNWQEVSVITVPSVIEAVSDLFQQIGAGGVVIEDPELLKHRINERKWDAFQIEDRFLTAEYPVVKGYFPVDNELSERIEKLSSGIKKILERVEEEFCKIEIKNVSEEDWVNSWKVHFKPVKVGERVVIRPTWEEYAPTPEEVVIDLDPGMAFGTGTHASTSMCIRLLEKYLKSGASVLDVGTGTGILAMTTVLLGAEKAIALDNDGVAIRTACANIELNGLSGFIQVRKNDLLAGIEDKVDLIVANIVADVIIKLMPQVKLNLNKNGLFITSGVIKDREQDVSDSAQEHGFILLEKEKDEEWVAQVWQLKEI